VQIKTPKYVIQQANEPPSFIRQHWLLFSLMVLAVVTFLIGKYSNIDMLNAFKGQKQTWDEVNQQLTEENEAQQKTISLLQTELKIKDQAISELQKSLAIVSQEKASFRADLVFYENLLSHKNDIKSLRVFDIKAHQSDNLVTLKLVLAQKLEKAQVIDGTVKLTLRGIKEDKGNEIDLIKQFNLDNQFSFKYFQVKKYTISLPNGFNPTKLLVELQDKDKKQKAVSEQFLWSDIIDNEPISLAENQPN
jgi:hypothetical protein